MATFSIALSGLTAANSALDITSNNIANANTIGFKNSQAEFADVYAVRRRQSQHLHGRRRRAPRRPPRSSSRQGNIITDRPTPLDLAINGNGFFTLNSPNGTVYTRNGQFSEDANGNVVSSTGQFLQVYPPLANGGFNTGALQNLNLQTAQSAPVATTTGNAILNLPSNATPAHGRRRSIRPIRTPTTSRPRPRCTTRSAIPIRRRSTSPRPRRPALGT